MFYNIFKFFFVALDEFETQCSYPIYVAPYKFSNKIFPFLNKGIKKKEWNNEALKVKCKQTVIMLTTFNYTNQSAKQAIFNCYLL